MKITVTQDHINAARDLVQDRGNHRAMCCPIALALSEGRDFGAIVGKEGFYFTDEKVTRPLPEMARSFVYDFDYGHPLTPFEFEVEI